MSKLGPRGFSDEKVKEKTGKSTAEWNKILDDFNPPGKNHYLMAKYLRENLDVSSWWSQTITVRYEYEQGLR